MRRFSVLAMIATFAAAAHADWFTRVLQVDGTAIPAFQGTEHFVSPVTAGMLDANVDYAVYAPGAFVGSLNPFAGYPGYNPADYMYAYQMYNNGAAHQGAGTVELSQVALGLSQNGLVSSLGHDPNYDPTGADVPATLAFDFGNSAVYLFVAPFLNVDEYSEVLLLSSPFPPVFSPADVVDGGGTVMGTLPAPAPEPASMLCLLLLGTARWIRRR